jgi:hypothetical protein
MLIMLVGITKYCVVTSRIGEIDKMEDSYIVYSRGRKEATSYVGKDATELFRVNMLKVSIRLWVKTGMKPTRGMGIRKMLDMATQYTGRKYKTSEAAQAIDDLHNWVTCMVSAMPIEEVE